MNPAAPQQHLHPDDAEYFVAEQFAEAVNNQNKHDRRNEWSQANLEETDDAARARVFEIAFSIEKRVKRYCNYPRALFDHLLAEIGNALLMEVVELQAPIPTPREAHLPRIDQYI